MDESLFGLTRDEWLETALAAGIVVAVIVIAALFASLITRSVHFFTRSTESQLDDRIAERLRRPFVLLVAIWGLAIGIGTLSYGQQHASEVRKAAIAFSVIVVAVALRRVLVELLNWQAAKPGGTGRLHPGSIPLIRRGVTLLLFASAALVVLDTLGVSISPLLAGLGIGGLAVALALQPLLANVFASSYMLSDASIRIGDWVAIDGGPTGFVDDIGWRATRIRSFDNNVVIVPNSTLADSTVTNYSLTSLEGDASTTVTVAYESDLEHVERVSREVMGALKEEWETALKDHDSVCSFTAFGDSGIEVLLKMRALTWIDSFGLRHELVKRIHAAYRSEGIVLAYPARRLLVREDDVPGLAAVNGANGASPDIEA